jgi:hypothetical protein
VGGGALAGTSGSALGGLIDVDANADDGVIDLVAHEGSLDQDSADFARVRQVFAEHDVVGPLQPDILSQLGRQAGDSAHRRHPCHHRQLREIGGQVFLLQDEADQQRLRCRCVPLSLEPSQPGCLLLRHNDSAGARRRVGGQLMCDLHCADYCSVIVDAVADNSLFEIDSDPGNVENGVMVCV